MRIGTPLVILAWLLATSTVIAAPVEDHSSSSSDLTSTSVSSSATSEASSSAPSSSATESASNSTESSGSLAPESTSSASLTSSASSPTPSPSGNSSCGPVPNNTLPNSDDAIPNQYIVSLKASSNVQQHFSKVQTAMAKNLVCHDPGAPTNTSLNTTDVIQIPQGEAIYHGLFSDRDVAFIQNTSEFQSISRDMKAVESRKRATGSSWNIARLAQANRLQPGTAGQGTSDSSNDWNIDLEDNLGQNVYIYVIDTGVDGTHPLLTPRVTTGRAIDGGPGNVEGDGHGTEVAGAAAAEWWGVASGATIVPIKIYDSAQNGDLSDLINGVDEAIEDFQLKQQVNSNSNVAAIINISVDAPDDPGLQANIAYALQIGMHVVIAAGNEGRDRSDDWITRRENENVQAAINVGATDIGDNLATFPNTPWAPGSNYGACVDVYAGGYSVLTSGPNQDQSKLAYGTSVAAPQVAGIIAGVISLHGNNTPAQMKAYILSIGTTNKIRGLSGSSNNLLAQLPSSFLAS
ncbi:peptidase S8/S53 domain-containing protein [Mycena galericulata]|nr:peptidase S8/S53 domain-containing protein [Mycena galericulata]KAJ7493055.1 peptidase S8/S53 domain-containing protein [Mycena galericulata]